MVSRKRFGQQLFLLPGRPFVVIAATAVVIEEPRIITLIGPRATDAVYKHISIGCGGGRGCFVKILSLRACDLLLVTAKPK